MAALWRLCTFQDSHIEVTGCNTARYEAFWYCLTKAKPCIVLEVSILPISIYNSICSNIHTIVFITSSITGNTVLDYKDGKMIELIELIEQND